ncbi:hypothetical protein E2562_015548, partial [Oryza meyeriana var. granulata]
MYAPGFTISAGKVLVAWGHKVAAVAGRPLYFEAMIYLLYQSMSCGRVVLLATHAHEPWPRNQRKKYKKIHVRLVRELEKKFSGK